MQEKCLIYILLEQKKVLQLRIVSSIYLVNAESMVSCSIYSQTSFKSKQLCMKKFVAVVDAEE